MSTLITRRRIEQFSAAAAITVTLLSGIVIHLTSVMSSVAGALFFVSLLTSNLVSRGWTILVATVASAATLGPSLWEYDLTGSDSAIVTAEQLLWVGAYWMASALLIWDPRRRNVGIETLRDAFEHAPAATALTDIEGRIIHANDAFAELVDLPRPSLPGSHLNDLLGDETWSARTEERNRLTSGELDFICFQRDFSRHDGLLVPASIYIRLLKDHSGEPSYSVVQVHDLTEQRDIQEALAASESRFRGIIENTEQMTLVVDSEGAISYANPIAIRLLAPGVAGAGPRKGSRKGSSNGSASDTLSGVSCISLIHEADRVEFDRLLEKTYRKPRDTLVLSNVRLARDEQIYLDIQLTGLGQTPGIEGTVVNCRLVTDQVRAEQQLRDSQSKLSTIFHSSPDAILILRDNDSMVIDFNTSFTRLLGYTRDEAIGLPESDLNIWADPTDREKVLSGLQEQFEFLDYETRLVAKNGEVIHAEISVRYVELDGELCVLCIGRDITKRRDAEAALSESEDKFAGIFSATPDGIVTVNLRSGEILDINDAFLLASGYEHHELVGKQLDELPIFGDGDDFRKANDMIAETGAIQNLEITFRTKQDELIPALISASVVELNGERTLVCIAKDHSAQRNTEEQLRRSEERFRGAFENAPIGMLLVDPDGNIFQANHFALDLLDYTESNLLGSHISRLVPVEDRTTLKESLDELLYRDESVSHAERRMLCHNSIEIWTNYHVVLQRNENGEPLYFIVQIGDITDMKRSHEQMERMAFYDTLTDLANRRLFSDRLEQAVVHSTRSGNFAALLYLDLDQFKRVNDTLGHEAGDELLREVARRLSNCVRQEDTVARPGGDEFTILLYEISAPGDAGRVAEKILEELRAPVTISGHQLVVTTSIGITIIPSDSVQPNVLTKNADLAMYRAKERGRNTYRYYSEDMNTQALRRLETENELREALVNDEFELFYQPKVRLVDQKIVGVEALIRWHHPTRGMVGPDQFIGIAEETGVIVEIGNWVVRRACEAAQRFSKRRREPIQVAVNISPRQFRDPNLATTIRRCVRESGIEASQIELEITETMLIDDAEAASVTIERLHELGLRIAIDDFGTGYSSLNYLKRFPIDTIKVDRSFVMDIPDNADDMEITAAVIAMAHGLKLEVVAEGIETAEQLGFLTKHHCEYGQGYYFSRPVPLSDVEKLLDPGVSLLRNPRQRPSA
jgi:diguanylate cyclase (GGDEF)-like protein/PAS domain S-box-containing protein